MIRKIAQRFFEEIMRKELKRELSRFRARSNLKGFS